VVIINDSEKKVEITYPCEWKYKVIGEKKEKIEDAVQSIMGERPHTLNFSKTSNKGNYHSYELRTLVHNEDDRTELFRQLKEHDDLKMVL
jgi:putative lipoic acid-binding regulatory protein